MDIIRKRKRNPYIKYIYYTLTVLPLLYLAGYSLFRQHRSIVRVSMEQITISEVKEEPFFDYIQINGQVHPYSTVQLTPLEEGIVEKILIEEGTMVTQGEPIVQLSNANIELSILNSEAELAEKQNSLRNTQVLMEQDRLRNRTEKLQLDLDVTRKKRDFYNQKELYDEKLIAREIYLLAREDYDLAIEKQKLLAERLHQDSIYRSIQISKMEESLENMQRNMELIRKRVTNLFVKSPINGELGTLSIELGQKIGTGQKIGQINHLSDFMIEAQIDEVYIDRVKNGLSATISKEEKQHHLKLKKVYPEVKNGQFKTDFTFVGKRPENLRIGQSYFVHLELSLPKKSIVIPKGSFQSHTGGTWIFVYNEKDKRAYKRDILLGRKNPEYYEVLDGLEVGEKVITTNYSLFGKNEIVAVD